MQTACVRVVPCSVWLASGGGERKGRRVTYKMFYANVFADTWGADLAVPGKVRVEVLQSKALASLDTFVPICFLQNLSLAFFMAALLSPVGSKLVCS